MTAWSDIKHINCTNCNGPCKGGYWFIIYLLAGSLQTKDLIRLITAFIYANFAMFSFKSPSYFNLLFSTESCKVLILRGLLSPSSSGWKLMKLGVPSLALSCLKTPKFMIYLSANRLRLFAIVINYSHWKRTLCFQYKKASRPSALLYVCGLFVYKKREIFEPHRLEILKLWLHTQVVWAPCGVCRLALQIVTLSTSNSYITLPFSVFISELK